MRVRAHSILALLTAAVLPACAGAGGSLPSAPNQLQSAGVMPVYNDRYPDSVAAAVTPQIVGVDNHNGVAKVNDPTYGEIWGYFNGTTSLMSQVVTLTANEPVQFQNVDTTDVHTVAFLGDASSTGTTWPATFNGGTIKSPKNTVISTTGWDTGLLKIGTKSLDYNAGPAGYYIIGCKIHYSHGMRTVVIVQAPGAISIF